MYDVVDFRICITPSFSPVKSVPYSPHLLVFCPAFAAALAVNELPISVYSPATVHAQALGRALFPAFTPLLVLNLMRVTNRVAILALLSAHTAP